MASQAFTLLHSATQAQRTLRVGGTLAASNWVAGAAVIYTVPSNKRLVVKGMSVQSDLNNTDEVRFLAATSATNYPTTLVLAAGTKIRSDGATAFHLTGFLEDDV